MEREREKIPAGDIKQKSKLLRWLDNFWYHNKIPTVIVLFVLIVVVVCMLQMCSAEDEDISLLYSGPRLMTASEHEGVRGVLSTLLPEDYNGDGRKYANLVTYHVKSDVQLFSEAAQTHEDGETVFVDKTYYTREYESYSNILMTGELSVCMLDPWLYEKLTSSGRLKKLSEIFDVMPSGAVGEYGVRLGDTALYRYYDAMKILPEDTVVCLMLPYVFGESSKAESYAKSTDVFKAIVGFSAPED